MIHYETTATFHFATNVRPELGIESEAKKHIKNFVRQEGIDAFLDLMEFEDIQEREISQEELDELIDNDEILIPLEGLKETLTAISLGLTEVEGITKEEAIEHLKRLSGEGDTPKE